MYNSVEEYYVFPTFAGQLLNVEITSKEKQFPYNEILTGIERRCD